MDGLAESSGKVLFYVLLGKEMRKQRMTFMELVLCIINCTKKYISSNIQLIGTPQPIAPFKDRFLSSVLHR